MMECFERPLREAIIGVDRFLEKTRVPSTALSANIFQEVSSRIESARCARELHDPASMSESYLALCRAYRGRLECLLRRLSDLETNLAEERNRLAQERIRLLRTREWHEAMSSTQ